MAREDTQTAHTRTLQRRRHHRGPLTHCPAELPIQRGCTGWLHAAGRADGPHAQSSRESAGPVGRVWRMDGNCVKNDVLSLPPKLPRATSVPPLFGRRRTPAESRPCASHAAAGPWPGGRWHSALSPSRDTAALGTIKQASSAQMQDTVKNSRFH